MKFLCHFRTYVVHMPCIVLSYTGTDIQHRAGGKEKFIDPAISLFVTNDYPPSFIHIIRQL